MVLTASKAASNSGLTLDNSALASSEIPLIS